MQTEETFWTLLGNLPHWEFEVFLIVIFDILIGAFIWPRVMKFFKHHDEDDRKIEELETKLKKLEDFIHYQDQ